MNSTPAAALPNVPPLEAVLCTEELNRRPSRPPDYEREVRALESLAQALADSPMTILQSLADTVLKLFQCDSVGVSLITEDGKRFYWPAIAGMWKPHIGGGTPRDFGPCGDVLDRNCPLLFRRPERRYTYLQPAMPPAEECLLVPFYVGGKAVGTIWVIAHNESRRFDNEDLRMLKSLGTFASAGYQAGEQLHSLRGQAHERQTDGQALREMNEALLISSVQQHELADQALQAEQRLHGSEVRYRRLFESTVDGILILDARTRRITDVNPFLLALLDYPREYFLGKELWEIGVFRDRQASQEAMQELEKGAIRFENLPLQDRGGQLHPVEIVANIHREDREPVIQCNIRDISERKRFEGERQTHLVNEQALRLESQAANRAKDMFLATLSHEIRTPLSAIIGWTSILSLDNEAGCEEAEVREGLDVIERNARSMVQLIDDVLDVSRIVSGKLRLEIRPCDFIAVVRAGVDAVRSAAQAKDITLSVELDPAASRASCDAGRMQQVVWNLVSNAVKFTPKGGTIRVTLAREPFDVRIEVSDSGQGIDPELLPYVFDRFRQADSSTRRKFGGLGLGLSIVKQLVELHGGTVHAHSEGEGQGSTFTVILPIRAVFIDEEGDNPEDENEFMNSAVATLPLVRLDGLRVLVVDDEFDARRLLVKVLEQAGAVVTAAASAAEAIEALGSANPEVLVSDLGMPDQDGFDLIREVRKRGYHAKDLPAIALTAFVHKTDRRQALLAGFQVHVPKPVDPHELTEFIASLAGRTGPPN